MDLNNGFNEINLDNAFKELEKDIKKAKESKIDILNKVRNGQLTNEEALEALERIFF